MRSYEGPATLVVGKTAFDVTCAIDEGYARADAPIMGWRATIGGLLMWGGYYRLREADRDSELHATLSQYPTATLRLPDGREAEVSINGDMIHSADGRWPA